VSICSCTGTTVSVNLLHLHRCQWQHWHCANL